MIHHQAGAGESKMQNSGATCLLIIRATRAFFSLAACRRTIKEFNDPGFLRILGSYNECSGTLNQPLENFRSMSVVMYCYYKCYNQRQLPSYLVWVL
jgi:hypothetical protein